MENQTVYKDTLYNLMDLVYIDNDTNRDIIVSDDDTINFHDFINEKLFGYSFGYDSTPQSKQLATEYHKKLTTK